MNFGQMVPGLLPLSYRFAIETSQWLELTAADYNNFIQGEQEDQNEPGEWPILDHLKALAYPSMTLLVHQAPQLLEELIKEWLTLEVLETLFPYSQEFPKYQYSINTLDKVRVDLQQVVLEGQAYPLLMESSLPHKKRYFETLRKDSPAGIQELLVG
jgi:hypothetical protein